MPNNQLLRNAFPKWFQGGGIFANMRNAPWNEEIDGVTLDIEYFGNRSGYKFCAPLVYNFLDENGEVAEDGKSAIARVILARYSKPWTRLWNLMKSEYDPLDNLSISEEIDMAQHTSGKDKNNGTVKDTGSLTTSHTGTDTNKSTGTEETARTGQNTSKDTTVTNGSGSASRSGYNSTQMVGVNGQQDNYSSTVNHVEIPNENSKRTPDLTDERTLALEDKDVHDLSTATDTTVERDSTTTDKGTRKRTGITGLFTRQRLVEQEREAWQWDFFESVFSDVDKVLALSVYDPCVVEQFDYTGGGTSGGYVLPVATNINLGGVRAPSKTNGSVQVQVDESGFLYVPPYPESSKIEFASIDTLGGIKLPSEPTGDGEEISTKNGVQFVVDQSLSPEGSYKNDETVSVVIPLAAQEHAGLVKAPPKTNETQQVAVSSDGTLWVSAASGGGGEREVVNIGEMTITPSSGGGQVKFSDFTKLKDYAGKTIKFTYEKQPFTLDVVKIDDDNYCTTNFCTAGVLGILPTFTILITESYLLSFATTSFTIKPTSKVIQTSTGLTTVGYVNVLPVWNPKTTLFDIVLLSDGSYLWDTTGRVWAHQPEEPEIEKLTVSISGNSIRFTNTNFASS